MDRDKIDMIMDHVGDYWTQEDENSGKATFEKFFL